MVEEAGTQTTLRDTIEQAVEEHVPAPGPTQEPAASPSGTAQAAEPSTATSERARDEQGRFAEKKDEPAAKAVTTSKAPVAAAAPAAPPKRDPVTRPSSWGKDHWGLWEKLASGATLTGDEAYQLAQLSAKREGDYAKGVSTYKTEWENAKPLLEALTPHMESIKQLGLQPAQFVQNLAGVHQLLSRGTQEQKLSAVMKLVQDYQIPVQNLFVRGQDGQVYYNPQVQPFQAQAQQRQAPQQDVAELVRKEIAGVMSQQQITQFAEAKDDKGNLLRPHFDTVKADMALLLEAGKAQDLSDAYRMALRMNDELWQSEQDAKVKADEAARLDAQRKSVAAARANAISPKSATPASQATPKGKGSVRSAIEEAVDQHLPAARV